MKQLFPKCIHAQAIEENFLEILRKKSMWQVHSQFKRTVNLNAGDEILALACKDSSKMPDTLITCCADFSQFALINQQVSVQTDWLIIGHSVAFSLTAPVFSSYFHPFIQERTPVLIQSQLDHLAMKFSQQKKTGSFFQDASASRFEQVLTYQLNSITQDFYAAVLDRNRDAIIANGQRLIGLGIGLTPSGDDYLVGFFAGMYHNQDIAVYFEAIAAAIIVPVGTRTNQISAAYLRNAAAHRFKEEICHLIHSVYQKEPLHLDRMLNQLLAIGATSGVDLTKGIIDALNICSIWQR